MATLLIASGIDPTKSILFKQSKISGHTELAWILSCLTQIGWLNRMIQFKEKSQRGFDSTLGLFSYPVLQAADILLYKATHVPIGNDQAQHLELAKKIALAFNRKYEQSHFPIPEIILGNYPRVMSLKDPSKKMSKSDPDDTSRININDPSSVVATKIKKAKTDSITGITYDPNQRPEIANLVNIFAAVSNRTISDICTEFATSPHIKFKETLIESLIQKLDPIAHNILQLQKERGSIEKILEEGSKRANEIAQVNIQHIKQIVGLERI